jgi:hypothetical protein
VHLIYQHWDGPMPAGEVAGRNAMRDYANRIGSGYRFDQDAGYFKGLPVAYGRFRPLHDHDFDQYDDVLYADTDVWPVDGLAESPFGIAADIGICTEPLQPVLRQAAKGSICTANDERWAKIVRQAWGVEMPRSGGLLSVYNAGVQVWSRSGRLKARREFVPFAEYRKAMRDLPPFYASDQHYLHAMMFVAGLDVVELDNDWNRFVHYLTDGREIIGVSDQRTPATKMVHVQLRGAGEYDGEKLWRIVNLPMDQWALH